MVLVSEGLYDAAGESIVSPIFKSERAVYYGGCKFTSCESEVVKKSWRKSKKRKTRTLRKSFCGTSVTGGQKKQDRLAQVDWGGAVEGETWSDGRF